MLDPRAVLERLCAERGEDFAGLSRMLGRNPAYIQQFVRRGVPKRLGEAERRKLARYFSISEALLGRTAPMSRGRPCRSASSSSGAGVRRAWRHSARSMGKPYFAFDETWLKGLRRRRASLVDHPGRRAIRWRRR